jgi:hypothetical protein
MQRNNIGAGQALAGEQASHVPLPRLQRDALFTKAIVSIVGRMHVVVDVREHRLPILADDAESG